MKTLLAALVVVTTVWCVHSAKPWELKKKLRDIHGDIYDLVMELKDMEDSTCLDRYGKSTSEQIANLVIKF